jgi:hypothetical protein
MTIDFVPDVRRVLRHAWSIRLIIAAGVFSALEAGIPFFTDSPPLPRGVFALLSVAVSGAAFYFRIVSQKEFANAGH